jgi:heptaprenyl diphosphate synthase
MNNFWKSYPQIEEELTNVNEIIKQNIKCREKFFETAIGDMVDRGGKMLRPSFLLLSGKFGDYNKEKLHNLAAVIEMLHMATLVHDDIIDDSKLRRGHETIQHKYGKEYAVYTGDFLLCQCLMMLSKYEYTMENMKSISKVMSKICMGEVTQYRHRYSRNINIRDYFRIVSGKTAALFALSFYVGAKESKCDDKMSKSLAKIGYYIGMAFQIIDDLLDYKGTTETLGKNAQKDLKRGYYTLPLIYALENDKENKIKELLKKPTLSDETVNEIVELVKLNKGIGKAKKLADRYTNKAFNQINKLPECESKRIIYEVVEQLLKRDY